MHAKGELMANSEDDLKSLLTPPRETLDVELKRWIDPASHEGIAKIAKGCLALRNNNGGRLVIGFTDDGQPDLTNVPADVRTTFHIDTVQAIVSRFAAEPFSIDVEFVEVNGQTYPVISVPAGVRSPVAAKSTLSAPDGRVLVRDHAVYVRSLNSNNTVSSTEARRGDWDRLTRICFDNREADIGGFVRRHLSAMNLQSLATLLPTFSTTLHQPTTVDQVEAELEKGHSRFTAATQRRRLQIPSVGFREAVILVNGEFPTQRATVSFLRNLLVNAPQHTGWTPWVDLSAAGDEHPRPYVFDGGWEAVLDYLDPERMVMFPHLDFWRIDPCGTFYHIRTLEDDLAGANGPQPHTELDIFLQIGWAAEVISMGLSFGRSLGCDESNTSLVFGFRWRGLSGRMLTSWTSRGRMLRHTATANQDRFTSVVTVPLETPLAGIAPHAENAVSDLFALFGGVEFESSVIGSIVSKTLGERN
jgi:hypothetical protein